MGIKIKSLTEQVTDFIWGRPLDAMSKPEQFGITTLRIGNLILRDISQGQITLRAMGLVYTTLTGDGAADRRELFRVERLRRA